jgi:tRNA threonylcarbamoyladenosine biosynthesis protein TsaE
MDIPGGWHWWKYEDRKFMLKIDARALLAIIPCMKLPSYLCALPDLDATALFASALAECIDDRAIIALNGPMGAGKTHLVQFIAEALNIDEVVNSPTFTMLNEYHSGRIPLFHLDLYRLSQAEAAAVAPTLFIELTEIMEQSGLVVIEWAELLDLPQFARSNFVSPRDHLLLEMSYDKSVSDPAKKFVSDEVEVPDELNNCENEGRKIFISPNGDASGYLCEKLAKRIGAMVGISMSRI